MEKPVIFSRVREEKAVRVDVISGKVIFYQRFIRVLDDQKNSESELILTLTPIEIFRNNLDILAVLYLEDEQAGPKEYEAAKDEIIQSIKEIYLAYFDPSRKARDQVLRSVWVVETSSRKYIFNAISGIIIEEQKPETGGPDELE